VRETKTGLIILFFRHSNTRGRHTQHACTTDILASLVRRTATSKPRRPTSLSDSHGAAAGEGAASAKRKPRLQVDYTPHTFEEYKTVCKPGNWQKMGTLGPDLQDDGLIEKVPDWTINSFLMLIIVGAS